MHSTSDMLFKENFSKHNTCEKKLQDNRRPHFQFIGVANAKRKRRHQTTNRVQVSSFEHKQEIIRGTTNPNTKVLNSKTLFCSLEEN